MLSWDEVPLSAALHHFMVHTCGLYTFPLAVIVSQWSCDLGMRLDNLVDYIHLNDFLSQLDFVWPFRDLAATVDFTIALMICSPSGTRLQENQVWPSNYSWELNFICLVLISTWCKYSGLKCKIWHPRTVNNLDWSAKSDLGFGFFGCGGVDVVPLLTVAWRRQPAAGRQQRAVKSSEDADMAQEEVWSNGSFVSATPCGCLSAWGNRNWTQAVKSRFILNATPFNSNLEQLLPKYFQFSCFPSTTSHETTFCHFDPSLSVYLATRTIKQQLIFWKKSRPCLISLPGLNPHVSLPYSVNMGEPIGSGDFLAHFQNQSSLWFSEYARLACFVAVCFCNKPAVHHVNSWYPRFLKWTKKAFSHIAVCLMVESDSPSGYKTGFNPFIPIIHLAPERHFILSSRN